jgi:hypothetical protein
MGKRTGLCVVSGIEYRNISEELADRYCSIWAVDYLIVQIELTDVNGGLLL